MLCTIILMMLDTIPNMLPEVTIFDNHQQRVELLARLVYSEAGNQSYQGKLAVANVVLNRMEFFEKSLEETIYKPNQFTGVRSKWFKRKYDIDSYKAALEVLSGYRFIQPDILYFANQRRSTNRTWLLFVGKFKAFQIEDHTFYYDVHARLLYQYTLRSYKDKP